MKRLFFSFFIVLIMSVNIYAHVPQSFKYQAIARDVEGSDYLSIGVPQMLSIPYALYAERMRITEDETLLTAGNTATAPSAPDSSAQFEVNSTTKGLLPPRMNQTQMEGITNPATATPVARSSSWATTRTFGLQRISVAQTRGSGA